MRKRLLSIVLVLSLMITGLVVAKQPAETKADDFYSGWKVNWSEEFDGDSLNRNVWNVEVNGYGGWNEEHQYYKDGDDTIQVNNGSLKIIGRKQTVWGYDASNNYKSYDYTSARINTENKVMLGNGRIEARIKLPIFTGTFPAFWLMGNNGKTWPECGEIDIMEAVNTENIAYGTAHWPKNVGTGSSDINSEGGGTYGWNLNMSDWHVYGVERSDTAIKWYVDGRVYHTVDLTKDAANQAPLKLDAYILLNLAIGGEWPGHVIDDSAFPATMEVDYVRHYVRDGSAPETEAPTTTQGSSIVDGTEVLKNTSFVGKTNWEQTSANEAVFSNAGDGSVTVNVPAYSSGNAWDTQLVQTPIALDSSKYYVATYTVTSSADKTLMFLAQKTDYTAEDATVITNVKAGETKLVKVVFKPSETRDYLYGIMMGYVNNVQSPATVLKISNVSMKVYNTEAAANAAANSIPEPTTVAPTTTQAPTTTVAPTTTQAQTTKVNDNPANIKVSRDVEINGYQVSYTKEGVRAVYTINNKVENQNVVERGLLYGLAGYANESDLYYNSNNAFVKTYSATNQGKLDVKYSSALPNGTSYAMTMLFGPKTSTEFSTEWVTRAYAKLADGSIVYSDASHYTIVNIAKKLYDGCKMQNKAGHEYLYNNIITKLYPNYAEVDYDWGGGIVS